MNNTTPTRDFGKVGQMSSLVQMVLDRNREQSTLFCSPDAQQARRRYRALHPTEIAWFKCMDGRLNGPVITRTPVGIIQPFRNLAGSFDLGWPYLGELTQQWVDYAVDQGRHSMPFITYHWSKSDKHKGCRGHGYDVEKAKADARRFVKTIEYAFGDGHKQVYPILTGLETDEDTMVLNGLRGQELNISQAIGWSEDELLNCIQELFSDMEDSMVNDLLPPLQGNIAHIKSIRENPRAAEETVHAEQILAIGRGFDWMHWLNRALIIGPYSYDLAEPIRTAAEIILDNIRKGTVSAHDGALLMTSGVYREKTGSYPRMAELKARSLEAFALKVIKESVPDLYPHMHVLSGTVDTNTRLFTPLNVK